jgi:DNA ligase 1
MKTVDLSSRRSFCRALLGVAYSVPCGAVVAAPALLLATEAASDADPTGFLVSEKYDGVRAFWDGRTLRFRSGRSVPAPDWFLARLPAVALDGELWLGRGRFEALSGMVRKATAVDAEWQQIKYMVFELPGAAGSFAERAATISQHVGATRWPALVAVEQTVVADRAGLRERLAGVVRAGGEGLMLHRADAPYVSGRSDVLRKLKPLDDAEAVVVGHVSGKGKFAGQLGALHVRGPDGREFLIGTGFADAERASPPPVGASVTYTHRGLTRTGLPRFASYLRVHHGF